MAKLSRKQVERLEQMWDLEAQAERVDEAIMEATKDLLVQRNQLRASLDEIENNVPESYEDEWSRRDSEHYRLVTAEARAVRSTVYDHLLALAGLPPVRVAPWLR